MLGELVMANNDSNKKLCYNSIKIINEEKGLNLKIEISPVGYWKIIKDGDSSISEGYKSWVEVYCFLSGFRKAILQY
jgi:hypothetical protein